MKILSYRYTEMKRDIYSAHYQLSDKTDCNDFVYIYHVDNLKDHLLAVPLINKSSYPLNYHEIIISSFVHADEFPGLNINIVLFENDKCWGLVAFPRDKDFIVVEKYNDSK